MPEETVIYRRTTLYEEIWAEPIRTVARRYGVSDVALAKVCRRLAVPRPGRGYRARRAAGQNPRRQPLPKTPEGIEDDIAVVRWVGDRAGPADRRPDEEAAGIEIAPIVVSRGTRFSPPVGIEISLPLKPEG